MAPSHWRALATPLLAIALVGCPEPDLPSVVALTPEIGVAPDAIGFGERAVPVQVSETFYITNGGRAELEATLKLEGDDVFELSTTELTLERDTSLPINLLFRPNTFLDYGAELVITSNDEDNPVVRIPITGTGVAAPMPDILIEPLALDFGEVDGTSETGIVAIRNVGAADLVLGSIGRAGSGNFSLLSDPSGNTLVAGGNFPILVQYTPTSTGGDSGSIVIPSNDPDEPELTVVLLGNGGADYEYPVALIDCPSTTNPPVWVHLDGEGSTDPEGNTPLSYEWTLLSVPTDPSSQVAISDAELRNVVGPYTDVFVDAVGTYIVQLVVENSLGIRSAPAICTVEAEPAEDLLVELTWDTPNADLDLHLALAGNDLFEDPGDASWCNRSPSWGANGGADDPSLNLDDRAGYGPENFAIQTPAGGMYDTRVHYFNDQGDDIVTATVRVYLQGELAPGFPVSHLLHRNEVWDVARINWPQATAALLSVEPYPAAQRQCFTGD